MATEWKINARTIQMTTGRAIVCALLTIAVGVLIGCAMIRAGVAAPSDTRHDRARRVITAWNEASAINDSEIPLLLELQENLKTNPPHLVSDVRRRELYKQIIAAHEAQTRNFKTMQENDK